MARAFEAEEFLELVYGNQRGWIDLPAKVGNYWVPFYLLWPDEGLVTRRIDSSLRDRENLYYSVAQFRKRGRNIEDTMASGWLWADLDEVNPAVATGLGLMPTVAVESSPGRYQALWELDRRCSGPVLERINRGLTYALDADKGGWDLTQVLRIPGTRNFKYPGAPMVEVMWYREDLVYDPREVWELVRKLVPEGELDQASGSRVVLPRRPISPKAKRLLRVSSEQVVEGERSAIVWQLECLLAEAGLTEEEIFELVWASAWNKWRGVSSGRRRLARDIRKAMAHVARRASLKSTRKERKGDLPDSASPRGPAGGGSDELPEIPRGSDGAEEDGDDGDVQEPSALPFVGYSSFMAMAMEEPKWLIENLWTGGSHGIIGGEPKTSKTTLAIAMALSVASGQPFLGDSNYPVGDSGPVLFVQEENAPWMMQDRMRKLAAHMGLISRAEAHVRRSGRGALGRVSIDLDFPVELPIRLLNNFGFDLAVDEHREMLEAEVEEVQPKLLILDPLLLILGDADENRASDLRPYLRWLLQLRYKYNCAIALVHHMRKAQTGTGAMAVRPGQRILGSTALHGWVDSAVYATALDDDRAGWVKARYETEFRSMAPQRPIEVAWSFKDPGSLDMDVEVGKYSLERLIVDMVTEEPGVTARDLAERLGLDKRTVLARVRGGEMGLTVESGKKGRGHSHRIYLSKNGDGGDDA